MPNFVPSVVQGRVVYAKVPVPDPQGRNPKEGRPFVVISTPEQIKNGDPLDLIGITTKLTESPAEHYSPVQYGHQAKTGLKERCAALCTWRITLAREHVDVRHGYVQPKDLLPIIRNVKALGAKAVAVTGPGGEAAAIPPAAPSSLPSPPAEAGE